MSFAYLIIEQNFNTICGFPVLSHTAKSEKEEESGILFLKPENVNLSSVWAATF